MTRSHLLTTMMMERPLSCAYPAIAGIELADAFGGIDDQQRDVGAFQMLARHHDRKLLRHQVRLAFAANAGGIDEAKAPSVVLDDFVDCVARGARESARQWRGQKQSGSSAEWTCRHSDGR